MLPQLGKMFYATWQIFIALNGQKLKNNVAVWSHCTVSQTTSSPHFLSLSLSCFHIKHNLFELPFYNFQLFFQRLHWAT